MSKSQAEYEAFMVEVDQILVDQIGLTHMDLPDMCTRNMFDDEMDAKSVAFEIASSACEDMGMDIDEMWGA